MDQRCGNCGEARPEPYTAGSAEDGPMGHVPGRMACGHYGFTVNEGEGQKCEYWKPCASVPKLEIVDGPNGSPKIVLLRTKTDEQRSNCIAKLGSLLDDAKSGKLRDVIIIGFREGDRATMHWTPQTDENGLRFVGALQAMSNLLISRMSITDPADDG